MRPIKFRVKGRNNQWHYGYPLIYNDESFSFVDYEKLNDDRTPLELCTLEYVEDDTLGEFTGLHDKNGREIYEGDVVIDCEYGRYEVVYDSQYMRFAFRQGNINWGMEALFDGVCDCQVLGNKYDHPYLLDDGGEL